MADINRRKDNPTSYAEAKPKADADKNRDGAVSLREAFDYAGPIVENLRHRQAGPQTPQMVSPKVLADMPVMTYK